MLIQQFIIYVLIGSSKISDKILFLLTKNFISDKETTDKTFWKNRQKPKYLNIIPNDLKCLLKDNSPLAAEMLADEEGNYFTSGHIDFYRKIDTSSGFVVTVYPITGALMQLRIPISTQNPM